jgi:hypothetical protein
VIHSRSGDTWPRGRHSAVATALFDDLARRRGLGSVICKSERRDLTLKSFEVVVDVVEVVRSPSRRGVGAPRVAVLPLPLRLPYFIDMDFVL